MTIELGILPAVGELDTDIVHPSRMWSWRRAGDLQPGWRLRLDDGRTVTVLDLPILVRLGRVQVPVWTAAHYLHDGLEPELVLLSAMRLVPTRTAVEQDAYLDAVDVHAARAAAGRGL